MSETKAKAESRFKAAWNEVRKQDVWIKREEDKKKQEPERKRVTMS